ncbi:MAG: CPBP family intramembrane metalloprotease [Planctomycetales bacterium]|nr:CPBP family intramembrane metalloprotease [Planctomycetales bacterium]
MPNSLGPVISSILALGLFASLVLWGHIVWRLAQGRELLAASPRRVVPWRGVHVALAFFVYVIVPSLSLVLVAWRFGVPRLDELPRDNVQVLIWQLAGGSLLGVVAALLVVTYLKLDLSATLADLGWSGRHLPGDIALGLGAFLVIAPPVYVLQYVLVLVYQQLYGESALHPLIEVIRAHPTPQMFFWSVVSAVLVAPLVEEFLFRVVLQGWLEKLVAGVRVAVRLAQEATQDTSPSPPTPNPSHPPSPPGGTPDPPHRVSPGGGTPQRVVVAPIFISSAIFAVFHLEHGPAPIPLFFLALGLGYLYQKTHRILPALVVHTLLNGTSLFGVWFGE